MIKRILFFLSLLFIIFAIYYYINKQGALDLVSDIKGTSLTGGMLVNKSQTGSLLGSGLVLGNISDKSNDGKLIVSDEIRATIEKELGLENWNGKIEIVKTDNDIKVVLNDNTKTTTDTNPVSNKGDVTPAPSSTTTKTTTTSSVPTKLSEADILMLKRMSRNVEID